MNLGFAKTVASAVICGTGATAGFVFYPSKGPVAILLAMAAIIVGFILAAVPMKGGMK
jgi:hypothetical protein